MKNNLFLGLAIISILFSCTTDDTADIIINDYSDNSVTNNTTPGGGTGGTNTGTTIYLTGTFDSDLTLDPINTYILNGPVIMQAGTTLTIPAGMTIKATSGGANIYIAISQGAKILASGTPTEPIVLTSASSSPAAGDWGGLILLGKAPINSVVADATSTSEIASLPYGGTDPTDNSGIVQYLRVEYSGGAADGQSENNGLSFYGVGSGTVVQYVESFEGKDDGFEFFGGTVEVSYLVSINNQDDSIDWTEGFSGKITNAYVKHGADHDKGIEADGYNTDYSNAGAYYSKPTITNVTIDGFDAASGTAVNVRAGTQGLFNNLTISNFSLAFKIDGDAGDNPTGAGVLTNELHVTDITFTNVATKLQNNTPEAFTEANFISGDGNGTATDFATWGAGWSRE
ncbi:multidrug transporter [Yeosuana sp.]|uniref:multidrug transporter n=1 Tax=Yeosuana sp. TaxID=2529388 RepID=UPI004054D5C3|tara:strand:- start:244 stop:1443 length:1200 start_codon:yes stop_codon:yes gene_type:complete